MSLPAPVRAVRRGGALLIVLFLAAITGLVTLQPAAAEPKDTYVIGTDTTYAPFEFTDESGELTGIDIDLLRAIGEDQGFEVEFQPLGFDAALQALQSNQVDGVIAGMTITEERQQTFDFTDPYFTGGVQFAALEGSDVESLEELDGEVVAVKNGTTGKEWAEEHQEQYGYTIDTYQETTDVVDAVRSGHAVGYFDDYPVIGYAITQGSGFRTVGEPDYGGDYGLAVNKGQNPELIEAFNAGLANLQESGEYDEIVDSYISAEGEEAEVQERGSVIDVAIDYWPRLLEGIWLTVLSTVVAVVVALVIGVIGGFGRISRLAPYRWLTTAYVYIFRGTPILVQAFFVFFAIPQMFPEVSMSPFVAGAITLSLNTGAYMTEIVRGGIQAVDPGQTEASRSLGLGRWTTMRKVVLPQAFRIMIPTFVNQVIITLKDTSLLSVIGLAELTYQSRQIIATTYQSSQVLIVVAVIYFVVITALTLLSQRLERNTAV